LGNPVLVVPNSIASIVGAVTMVAAWRHRQPGGL
jgi:hypothetical protein